MPAPISTGFEGHRRRIHRSQALEIPQLLRGACQISLKLQ